MSYNIINDCVPPVLVTAALKPEAAAAATRAACCLHVTPGVATYSVGSNTTMSVGQGHSRSVCTGGSCHNLGVAAANTGCSLQAVRTFCSVRKNTFHSKTFTLMQQLIRLGNAGIVDYSV